MNVLLINPPMQPDNPPSVIPFGFLYIAQELMRNGHKVELLDIDSYRFPQHKVLALIEKSNPDIIAIGGLVTIYPYLHWLIPSIRKLKGGTEIILGGGIASSLREKCFEKFDIDYEVIGEGELTIIELLNELEGEKNLDRVKGIAFKRNGAVIFTEKRPLMQSLDGVPLIDDTLIPVNRILRNSNGVLQIHAQRGCPSNCTFCFNCFRVVSGKVRYRPFYNVVDEISRYNKRYGKRIKLFAISGECLTMNKEWIISFCKEIIRRKLKISYRVTSRVDTIDEERLVWLKKSGCLRMSFGLETGSEKIMRIINKGASIEKGREAVALAKRYIPIIEPSIMLGYIGEDPSTLRDTVKLCKEIEVKPALFFALPFPGTELYKMAVAKGSIKDEEDYMMRLDRSSISSRFLNLTDMSDDEAESQIESSKNEVERFYFYRDFGFGVFKDIFRSLWLNITKNGFRVTTAKIAKAIKKYS